MLLKRLHRRPQGHSTNGQRGTLELVRRAGYRGKVAFHHRTLQQRLALGEILEVDAEQHRPAARLHAIKIGQRRRIEDNLDLRHRGWGWGWRRGEPSAEPARKGGFKRGQTQRLGQEVVHARCQAAGTVLGVIVAAERKDG